MTINSNTLFLRTVLLHDLGFVQSNSMIDSLFFPDKNVTYFKTKTLSNYKNSFFQIFQCLLYIYIIQVETWPCSNLNAMLPNIPLELTNRPGAAYLGTVYSGLELPI